MQSLTRSKMLPALAFALVLLQAGVARAEGAPASVAENLDWAEQYISTGRYGEAAEFQRKALAATAEGTPAWEKIALALVETLRIVGGHAEALEVCERGLKAKPDAGALAVRRGEMLTAMGRYEDAYTALDKIAEADKENLRAWVMRKAVAALLGKKEVIKKTNDFFFDVYGKKQEYFNSDDVKDPMELVYVGLGVQEEDPKSAFETGFMLAERQVEKRKMVLPEAYLQAARLALDVYSFDNAFKRYQAVLKVRPKLPDALVGMAQVMIAVRNDLKQAEPMLDEALKINPHHIDALMTKCAILMQDDKFDEAKQLIDRALEANPNSFDALAMQAFYYHDLNQLDKEAEVEKKVLAIDPKHADYYCSVGDLIESKRGFNEAPAYYQKAVALDPDYWRGYYLLGMNTSRQGAHGEEEGKRLLLRAFEMNKFNVWAINMIKVLDSVIGDREQGVPPVYEQSTTKHFTLKFRNKEAAIVRPYMEEWAEAAYEWQTKKFGFEPQGPLTIELCYSFQDQAARTVGLPNLGALGVCFGKLCTVVSPREGTRAHPPFNWRKVLEHEFGHVMTLQMSGFRVPRWYTEAFSTYLEDDSRLETDPMMVNAIAQGGIKDLDKMNEYFRENMLMAYVHGRYVIEYLDKTFGFEIHKQALKAFAEGKKVPEVLPAVTGKPLEELNKGQHEYVRTFFSKKVRIPAAPDQRDFARLEAAASKSDASAEDIAKLANAHMIAGQLQRAEAGALKALEKDLMNVDAIRILGELTWRKKDYEGAKQLYQQLNKVDPEASFAAWHRLGIIYKKEGRTTKAIEALEKARALYPRYVGDDNPYHLLPDLYRDLEPAQNEKAVAVWLDAVKANTEDKAAALKGLELAVQLKMWPEAAKLGMAHIEIDPYEPKVHRLLGQVYQELKDIPRAAREYRVLTHVDEKDLEAWVNLSRMEQALGNRDEAARAVQAALEIDATHEGAKAQKAALNLH